MKKLLKEWLKPFKNWIIDLLLFASPVAIAVASTAAQLPGKW